MQVYDLILLDLMLPGMSGNDFLKVFRKEAQTPIIVLSAKDELDSKVDLLSSGADDYLTKPFELRELIARVNVQLRRHSHENTDKSKDEEILEHKELILNKSCLLI